MAHIHAQSMMEYAKDALETDKPWERWQFSHTGHDNNWHSFTDESHPSWDECIFYRRKPVPNKIEINGEKFPAANAKPKMQSRFWVVTHTMTYGFVEDDYSWYDDETDRELFEAGNVFLTQGEAKAVADKLNQVFKNRVS